VKIDEKKENYIHFIKRVKYFKSYNIFETIIIIYEEGFLSIFMQDSDIKWREL